MLGLQRGATEAEIKKARQGVRQKTKNLGEIPERRPPSASWQASKQCPPEFKEPGKSQKEGREDQGEVKKN